MKVRASVAGTFLVAQFSVLAYFVWEIASWDVMEPFTYFLGLVTVAWCAAYFAIKKQDNTYDRMFGNALTKQCTKRYEKDPAFDPARFEALGEVFPLRAIREAGVAVGREEAARHSPAMTTDVEIKALLGGPVFRGRSEVPFSGETGGVSCFLESFCNSDLF